VTTVIFYEKPGCVSNARQQALLRALGHRLEVRDLLREPWTAERLRPFFGTWPVADWFNPTAPRVKSGEVLPAALDEAAALALMVADPILIRRPLIEVPAGMGAGFEPGPLLDALGVTLAPGEDLQSCSRPGPIGCPLPGVSV
jgi:nitrogenase-associated protein